jgi:hypothetical protein
MTRIARMEQRTLFDLEKLAPPARSTRTTALDRRLIIDGLREIHRLTTEPEIRQITEDLLFAHRIPLDGEPAA